MGKRGLSGVVTTLIMILLTLVAVGMIWLVVMNILKSSADEADIGKLTLKLSIENVKIGENDVNITVKRSPGKGEMTSIKFVLKNSTDSVIVVKEGSLVELESKTFIINTTQEGITPPLTEISMYAITKTGTGKEVPGLEYKYDVGTGTGGVCIPTGPEICDNVIDEDCDGTAQSCGTPSCSDSDGDGYGNPGDASCPNGAAEDCDDGDVNVWQLLNGYADSDNDNYGTGAQLSVCSGVILPIGYSFTNADCDDNNLSINPGTTEICNLIDDNCDGSIDEGGVCVTFLKTWSGLVSWWRFEGSVKDEIGRNNGTEQGGVDCNVPGKYGRACGFDGVDDYVSFSQSVSINISDKLTVSVWIYRKGNTQGNNAKIINKHMTTVSPPYFAYTLESDSSKTDFIFGVTSGASRYKTSRVFVQTNRWVHLVGVYNGTNVLIYENGILNNFAAGPSSINTYEDNLEIGGTPLEFNEFNGFIDEVMIFNRSLSASEISQIYAMNLSSG